MPAGLYMDVHVRAAITEGLLRRGVSVLTSQEDGTREWDDEALLRRATEYDRLLFSQDDLLAIAARWQQDGLEFTGLIYAHQAHTTIGQNVEDLELIAKCGLPGEFSNRVTYLPLT
jgi:hypothetical protein